MSFFESLFGRKSAGTASTAPQREQPALPPIEDEQSDLAARIEAQREEDTAKEAAVLAQIREREHKVAPPMEKVDIFVEDESLRTNQAALELELPKSQAFAERLLILRGLKEEIEALPSVDSDLARTRLRQIVRKRAEMMQQIPRYAAAKLENIQDTLMRNIEEGTLDKVITLSETDWQRSNEKVKNLQQMLNGLGSLTPEVDTIPVPLTEERFSFSGTRAATTQAIRTGTTTQS